MVNETSLWFIVGWILLTASMISYIIILRMEVEDANRASDFYKEMLGITEKHVEVLEGRVNKNVF